MRAAIYAGILLTLCGLLALATSASAECAWVLWERTQQETHTLIDRRQATSPRHPPGLIDSRVSRISIQRVREVGTMTVEERVADFLVKNNGKAQCNACLAGELGINRRQARNATLSLAESGRFHRDRGACSKRPHHRMGKVIRA